MISIKINNGETMDIIQYKKEGIIKVITNNIENITEGDFVMLVNYYKYVKNNNIQCDFINPNGTVSK